MGTITLTPSTGVIVTGGASGIGLATMHALAESGRPVAAWDLNRDAAVAAAEAVAKEHGVAAIGIGLDVRETAAFAGAIAASRDAMGSIGGLVHAAGIAGPSPVDSLDEDVWDAVQSIHLRSAALLIRDLCTDLVATPGSAVVLISSIESQVAHGAIPAYCAAKAGMLGLARATAAQLGTKGVRANCVCPGFIDTPLFAPAVADPNVLKAYEQRIPLGRLGRPEDIARTVRFLLSDDAAYVTAAEFVVDGGVTRTTF